MLTNGTLEGVFSVRAAEQRARWLGVAIELPFSLLQHDGERFFLMALRRGAGMETSAVVRWQDGSYSELPAFAV